MVVPVFLWAVPLLQLWRFVRVVCPTALLAPQEMLGHKRCCTFRNATSDSKQGVWEGMTF